MNIYIRLFCVTMLIAVASSFSGCIALGVGAAAAAGGVEYAEGRSSMTMDASVERVYNASVAVLNSKKYPIKHQNLSVDKADINSEYPGGDEIRIDIDGKSDKVCELHVRVGLTGHRDQEAELIDAIKHRV